MAVQYVVEISRFAEKQLRKLPLHIKEALYVWAESAEEIGLLELRKIPAYHDEPLKGQRRGQRSVRLNRSYRVIYEETKRGIVHVIGILEVNKHDY